MSESRFATSTRIGDGHSEVFISIGKNLDDDTIAVRVHAVNVRGDAPTEEIRFCGRHGGHSPAIQRYLGALWHHNQSRVVEYRRIDFKGDGGYLRLFIGKGDSDYRLKTHNLDEDIFCDVSVLFPLSHKDHSVMSGLLGALLQDNKDRPIK